MNYKLKVLKVASKILLELKKMAEAIHSIKR